MSIKSIAADLAIAPTRPKGIKVSVNTWKEMKKLGLIEMKGVAAWSVFDLGYEMPFYDGDVRNCRPGARTKWFRLLATSLRKSLTITGTATATPLRLRLHFVAARAVRRYSNLEINYGRVSRNSSYRWEN